jgi:N-acylneuraminate cytidylyltransferase
MLGFVAAKGHSARVPRKNMRDFDGAPLFHRILSILTQASTIDQVVLDSDSDEILSSAAASFGNVMLIERPSHLVGDDVEMNLLIANAFEVTGASEMLQTHATNPLLRPATVDAAVAAFRSDANTTSLMSVTPLQTRLYWEDLRPINHDPSELLPTQRLPVVYEENSNIYIVDRSAFELAGHRVTPACQPFPMDPLEATDIDSESDFELAYALYRGFNVAD